MQHLPGSPRAFPQQHPVPAAVLASPGACSPPKATALPPRAMRSGPSHAHSPLPPRNLPQGPSSGDQPHSEKKRTGGPRTALAAPPPQPSRGSPPRGGCSAAKVTGETAGAGGQQPPRTRPRGWAGQAGAWRTPPPWLRGGAGEARGPQAQPARPPAGALRASSASGRFPPNRDAGGRAGRGGAARAEDRHSPPAPPAAASASPSSAKPLPPPPFRRGPEEGTRAHARDRR